MTAPVQFLRVVGVRSQRQRGAVVAVVDRDAVVKWDRRRGWSCTCPTPGDTCPHVNQVAELLDPRVTATPTAMESANV